MLIYIHRINCFCDLLVHCCFWMFLHTGHMQPFSNFSLFHIFWNKFNHFLQFSVSKNSMLLFCCLRGDWLKIRFCVRPTFSVVKLAPEPLIFSRARNFAAVSIMLKWSDTGKISWAKLSLKLSSAFLSLDCPNLFTIFRPKNLESGWQVSSLWLRPPTSCELPLRLPSHQSSSSGFFEVFCQLRLYNHTGNCNIDWIDNGRNESVPIADTEKQQWLACIEVYYYK